MLKMTAEGSNVDAANWAARYIHLLAGLLITITPFALLLTPRGQVSSFARSLNDLRT